MSAATIQIAILGLAAFAPFLSAQLVNEADLVSPQAILDWNDPEWWKRRQAERRFTWRMGRSDLLLEGPLVSGMRRQRVAHDATLAQRIGALPVVSLFIPQPLPRPSRTGRYLAWGERDVAWSTIAEGTPPGPVGLLSLTR
jgi:hypothetical protein